MSEKAGSAAPAAAVPLPEVVAVIKTNPYDALSVKHLLDDTAVDLVQTDRKFSEDYSFSNRKLLVGGAACALAIASHFAPIPYPQNWWLLVFCVAGYLVFTFQLGRWDAERGHTILITKSKNGNKISLASSIRTTETGDCEYELEAENLEDKKQAKFSASITEFIDAEGKFFKTLFALKVDEILDAVISFKKTQ